MAEGLTDSNYKLNTRIGKDFEDLQVEVSKFDISAGMSPSINFGNEEITKNHLNEYLNNFPLFKEVEKYKAIYTDKQQELLKYFASQHLKMEHKIKELQKIAPPAAKVEPKVEFKAYQDDEIKSAKSQNEMKFLLILKEKMKQLTIALKKERADKLKLSNMLRKDRMAADTSREPRLSLSK